MNLFTTIALCMLFSTFSALISYRLFVPQTSMFVFAFAMFIGFIGSTHLPFLAFLEPIFEGLIQSGHPSTFPSVVTEGLLSYLLFAGCLHIDTNVFQKRLSTILQLAFGTTALAIGFHTFFFYYLGPFAGISLPILEILLLSTAIAPTDPVAVLALLKKVPAPKAISTLIAGESLLNDGFALAVFTLLSQLSLLKSGHWQIHQILINMGFEITLCTLLGFCMHMVFAKLFQSGQLIRENRFKFHMLSSIFLINLNYLIATHFHISSALSIVIFGLFASKTIHALTEKDKKPLLLFWDTIDEILNAILFFTVGIEVVFLSNTPWSFLLIAFVIAILGFSRMASVLLALINTKKLPAQTRAIVSLGGIKGALSLAMILTLNHLPSNNLQLMTAICYCVVAFTIIVQGTLLEWLLSRTYPKHVS